jgi:hypothetical protein
MTDIMILHIVDRSSSDFLYVWQTVESVMFSESWSEISVVMRRGVSAGTYKI